MTNHIADVHQLDDDVEDNEVVAIELPPEALAAGGHEMIAGELHQETAHVFDHVTHRLVATIKVHLALALDGGVCNGGYCNSCRKRE